MNLSLLTRILTLVAHGVAAAETIIPQAKSGTSKKQLVAQIVTAGLQGVTDVSPALSDHIGSAIDAAVNIANQVRRPNVPTQ